MDGSGEEGHLACREQVGTVHGHCAACARIRMPVNVMSLTGEAIPRSDQREDAISEDRTEMPLSTWDLAGIANLNDLGEEAHSEHADWYPVAEEVLAQA